MVAVRTREKLDCCGSEGRFDFLKAPQALYDSPQGLGFRGHYVVT